MAFHFLKRDFPDIDSKRIDAHPPRRIATALYLFTHGLWLFASMAALLFSLADAMPAGRQMLLVAKILE